MAQRLLDPKLIFLGAAALLVTLGAGMVYSAMRFTQDSKWVIETSTILRELDDVATLQQRAVATQRGYLLTSEPELRDEFWDARATLFQESDLLLGSVKDPGAAAMVRELKPMIQKRVGLAVRTLTIFEGEGLDAAKQFIATNGSRVLDRKIRATLESVRARELALLRQRRDALDRSAGLMVLAAALGIPISLAMLAMVNRALVRENAERRRTEREATASAQGYKKLSSDMASLTQFAGMLQSCEDGKELLQIAAQGFQILAPALAGTVYLVRASKDHAEVAAQWGEHAISSDPVPVPTACWAVRRNQRFLCEDVRAALHCAHVDTDKDLRSATTACIPLSAQGNLMGWLFFSRPGTGPIAEYGVVMQAAEQFSLALANVRLQQDLRHQSIRDPLTGLYNRRYLEESLARELSRCSRRGLPLVVMMFDIDHFKAFNDLHGHPGGDAVLAAFGRLLQASCRPEDIACRFGGEEFTIILPEADLDTGLQRARAMLEDTAQMVVALQGVSLGRVTTSIGIAALPTHGTTAAALVDAADKALFRAKKEGRNRACVAGDPAGQASAPTVAATPPL